LDVDTYRCVFGLFNHHFFLFSLRLSLRRQFTHNILQLWTSGPLLAKRSSMPLADRRSQISL